MVDHPLLVVTKNSTLELFTAQVLMERKLTLRRLCDSNQEVDKVQFGPTVTVAPHGNVSSTVVATSRLLSPYLVEARCKFSVKQWTRC